VVKLDINEKMREEHVEAEDKVAQLLQEIKKKTIKQQMKGVYIQEQYRNQFKME
jgi:hypothetical protein